MDKDNPEFTLLEYFIDEADNAGLFSTIYEYDVQAGKFEIIFYDKPSRSTLLAILRSSSKKPGFVSLLVYGGSRVDQYGRLIVPKYLYDLHKEEDTQSLIGFIRSRFSER